MNSASIKFKKFMSNRNTVVIICAILGVLILFFGYNIKVNNAIEPVKIPYAKKTIQPRTEIKEEMIDYIEVPKAALSKMGKDNIITKVDDIIGSYSNINTLIPAGSMFYSGAVVDKEDLPNAAVYDVPEGHVLKYLKVNMDSSYVNSIVPGGYIDIYIKTTDRATSRVRVGKFIEKIEVLSVKTSDGLNVFENSEEARVPYYVLFTLPKEQFILLTQAEMLGLTITPVPINIDLTEVENIPESSVITSTQLEEYISELADEFIQDEIIIEDDNEITENNNILNNDILNDNILNNGLNK